MPRTRWHLSGAIRAFLGLTKTGVGGGGGHKIPREQKPLAQLFNEQYLIDPINDYFRLSSGRGGCLFPWEGKKTKLQLGVSKQKNGLEMLQCLLTKLRREADITGPVGISSSLPLALLHEGCCGLAP